MRPVIRHQTISSAFRSHGSSCEFLQIPRTRDICNLARKRSYKIIPFPVALLPPFSPLPSLVLLLALGSALLQLLSRTNYLFQQSRVHLHQSTAVSMPPLPLESPSPSCRSSHTPTSIKATLCSGCIDSLFENCKPLYRTEDRSQASDRASPSSFKELHNIAAPGRWVLPPRTPSPSPVMTSFSTNRAKFVAMQAHHPLPPPDPIASCCQVGEPLGTRKRTISQLDSVPSPEIQQESDSSSIISSNELPRRDSVTSQPQYIEDVALQGLDPEEVWARLRREQRGQTQSTERQVYELVHGVNEHGTQWVKVLEHDGRGIYVPH